MVWVARFRSARQASAEAGVYPSSTPSSKPWMPGTRNDLVSSLAVAQAERQEPLLLFLASRGCLTISRQKRGLRRLVNEPFRSSSNDINLIA
ncbi:hypothetical protein AVEN_150919-1 [Araneus ventricosus]|uniref:Uncharacterized protein n=1 Tax=Araneus ventricosus TaxID=182803 RepID=A0A4Y2CA61_ARAVE|nr:hypothetical protein AVEN_150919-1 [Araneus ventricosus]